MMNRNYAPVIAIFVLLCTVALLAQDQPAATADYSGMYSFLQEGEFVQINVEDQGVLTGFVSRYGELDSDKGAFLDQFFKKGKIQGNKVEFVTESVHGINYEFHGAVTRGSGKTPDDDGYYVLRGTLTKASTDADKRTKSESREVELKSFPKNLGGDAKATHRD